MTAQLFPITPEDVERLAEAFAKAADQLGTRRMFAAEAKAQEKLAQEEYTIALAKWRGARDQLAENRTHSARHTQAAHYASHITSTEEPMPTSLFNEQAP